MKLRKLIWILVALLALGLGTLGIFLPILPTVPLYLLTVFCFANSSEKMHNWFLGTKLYKRYVEPYRKAGGLTRKAKIWLIVCVSLQIAIAAYLVRGSLTGEMILAVLYLGFIISMLFVVKTVP